MDKKGEAYVRDNYLHIATTAAYYIGFKRRLLVRSVGCGIALALLLFLLSFIKSGWYLPFFCLFYAPAAAIAARISPKSYFNKVSNPLFGDCLFYSFGYEVSYSGIEVVPEPEWSEEHILDEGFRVRFVKNGVQVGHDYMRAADISLLIDAVNKYNNRENK